MKDFQELQDEIGTWADETFENHDLKGVLNHLIEEAEHLAKNPYNAMNYADVLILLMTAARMTTYDMQELAQAVETKLNINKARIWLEPDSKGIIRHAT